MVNVVQQCRSKGLYNVWEDVDLKKTNVSNDELIEEYIVHKLNAQDRRDFRQSCNWKYEDLYVIKDIYGGFLEFLK